MQPTRLRRRVSGVKFADFGYNQIMLECQSGGRLIISLGG